MITCRWRTVAYRLAATGSGPKSLDFTISKENYFILPDGTTHMTSRTKPWPSLDQEVQPSRLSLSYSQVNTQAPPPSPRLTLSTTEDKKVLAERR